MTTNKLEQAARQALVALEDVMADFDGNWALANTAITALREALAEQERKAKYDERFERLEKFEQAEQEPLMITPGGGAFPFAVVGELEQPEQEPVAWMFVFEDGEYDPNITFDSKEQGEKWLESDDCLWDGSIAPVYAAPVRTKDLTDDEIEECVHIADSECTEDACMPWFIEFARAVIAADRSKNGII